MIIPDLFVCFSTETTGLISSDDSGHVHYPSIISVGAALVDQGSVIDTMNLVCRPDQPIEPGATRCHGLTEAFLKDYPIFGDIASDIAAYLDPEVPLITHAADFHWTTLQAQFKRSGILFERPQPICLSKLCTPSDAPEGHPGPALNVLRRLAGLDASSQVDDRLDASADAKDIAQIALFIKHSFTLSEAS